MPTTFEPGRPYALAGAQTPALLWWARRHGFSPRQHSPGSDAQATDAATTPPLQKRELLILHQGTPAACHPQRWVVCTHTRSKNLTPLPLLEWVEQDLQQLGLDAAAARQLALKPDIVESTLAAQLPYTSLLHNPGQHYVKTLFQQLGHAESLHLWSHIPRSRWYPLFYGPTEQTAAYHALRRGRLLYYYLSLFLDWGRTQRCYGEALSSFAAWVYFCAQRGEYSRREPYYNLTPGEEALRLLQKMLFSVSDFEANYVESAGLYAGKLRVGDWR